VCNIIRVVEGKVSRDSVGQHSNLISLTRLPHAFEKLGQRDRVPDGDLSCDPVGQRSDLFPRSCITQCVEQVGQAERVIECGTGGAPASRALVGRVQAVQSSDKPGGRVRVAVGSGVLVQLGGVTLEATVGGGGA
jgi:hypothetical protein